MVRQSDIHYHFSQTTSKRIIRDKCLLVCPSFCEFIWLLLSWVLVSLRICSFFHSLMRSFVNCNSFIRSFLPFYSFHSFVRFVRLFVRLFVHGSFIHSFINSLILFFIDYPISFFFFFLSFFFLLFYSILFYPTLFYSIPFYPFHCVLSYSISFDSFRCTWFSWLVWFEFTCIEHCYIPITLLYRLVPFTFYYKFPTLLFLFLKLYHQNQDTCEALPKIKQQWAYPGLILISLADGGMCITI